MKEREQKPSEEASAAWDLAAGLLEIVGEFGFIGFVLYLAIMVPIVVIATFLDW